MKKLCSLLLCLLLAAGLAACGGQGETMQEQSSPFGARGDILEVSVVIDRSSSGMNCAAADETQAEAILDTLYSADLSAFSALEERPTASGTSVELCFETEDGLMLLLFLDSEDAQYITVYDLGESYEAYLQQFLEGTASELLYYEAPAGTIDITQLQDQTVEVMRDAVT